MTTKFPEVVYKYRDWNNPLHKKMLTDREIYLSSPKDLNDPFDCRVTLNFSALDSDEEIITYLDCLIDRHRSRYETQKINLKEFKGAMYKRLKNNLLEVQDSWEKAFFVGQNEWYGVFSLSARWNSILMWGHYSSCHTGFCFGFYEEKLRTSERLHRGGMVNYVNDFPSIHPSQDMTPEFGILQTFTKAKDWEYEEEYRLLTFEVERSNRLMNIDKSFFAELIIGLNFPKRDLPEMFELSKELEIPLFQIQKVPYKFGLRKERIEKL